MFNNTISIEDAIYLANSLRKYQRRRRGKNVCTHCPYRYGYRKRIVV